VVVQDGVIAAAGADLPAGAPRLDLDGAYVLPGLIDCHVHATAVTGDLSGMRTWPASYVQAHASRGLEAMVRRGFTRVRDVGGADWGLAMALEEGLINGPRLHFGGFSLSQTGGHGDARARGEDCGCASRSGLSRVVDGPDNLRVAVRDEARRGAHHIKLMVSGGVASPTDRLERDQYSDAEISAAVDEAARAGLYVAGHAYMAHAIDRAVRLGVRTIEHANYLDEASLATVLSHEAYLVPTLITYSKLRSEGAAAGVPLDSLSKIGDLSDAGLRSLAMAAEAGAKVAFGTDLLGSMQVHQTEEFLLRAQVQSIADVIRSATVVSAELLGIADTVGLIEAGYVADLIAVSGNPLLDAAVLARPEVSLRLVLIDGAVRYQAQG
jgi:imidazolonepropionase-like amidohydrolase